MFPKQLLLSTGSIVAVCSVQVAKVILGKDGLLSTPAASYLIYKYKAVCGIILTASTAHAGNSSYFGIKINGSDGGKKTITHLLYVMFYIHTF